MYIYSTALFFSVCLLPRRINYDFITDVCWGTALTPTSARSTASSANATLATIMERWPIRLRTTCGSRSDIVTDKDLIAYQSLLQLIILTNVLSHALCSFPAESSVFWWGWQQFPSGQNDSSPTSETATGGLWWDSVTKYILLFNWNIYSKFLNFSHTLSQTWVTTKLSWWQVSAGFNQIQRKRIVNILNALCHKGIIAPSVKLD